MVYNHGYFLAQKAAYHAHLVAGAERHGCEAVVCHVFDAEIAFVVQQAYVHASGVGRVVMHDAEVELGEFGLCHEVFEHCAVFDFGHSDYGRTQRGGACFELRYGIGEVVEFLAVFAAVPLALSVGCELEVAPLGIVRYGVEEVFKVVECHAGNEQFAFGFGGKDACSGGRYEQCYCCE